MKASKAKSVLGACSAGTSGVGLRLLPEGRFVNDAFIAATFLTAGTKRTHTAH